MKNILLLDKQDNVAIALHDLLPGETVTVKGRTIVCIKLEFQMDTNLRLK